MFEKSVFFIIVLKIIEGYSQGFIYVNLSNYKFITEDKPVWLNQEEITIPTFFEELEFICNSSFPTKWILSKNPMEEKGLMAIPKISKFRSPSTWSQHNIIFSSKINFRFKDPRRIPIFSCQSIETERLRNIVVESAYASPTKFTLKFLHDKVIPSTEKVYGESQDCSLVLEVDFQRKAFACEKNGLRNLSPWVVLCRNPDECDSIAYSGTSTCGNSVRFKCDNQCNQFMPRKEPGVILCGDGINSLAVKYTVIDIENTNISHLVTFDNTNEPSNFIHLLNTSYVVYNKQQADFVCKASKYVFSEGFQWKLETDNGSSLILDGSNETVAVVDGTYMITKKVIFDFSKTGNVTKLSCIGPLWNSRNNAVADCNITLKESIGPTIVEKDRIIQQNSGNTTLKCSYQAEPTPKVTWFYWRSPVTEALKFLKVFHKNGSSSLTILNLERQAQEGRRRMNITCRVENFLGMEERVFSVRIEPGEESGHLNKILLICAICLLLIIALILSGGWLYLVWVRKQNLEYIKKDIQLFLEGNPEIVTKDEKDIPSLAQKKPYNTDLEIPFENLEIDRKKALGAGAYGMVLRGLLSGSQSPTKTEVAIKTVRSNVEPSYFKALLTELKIMIFVGEHENIVNLLGACTNNIYQMELYIVMEFCPNGELEEYLKTHRTDYLENISGSRRNNAMSSNDLLRWSYEIANGMDYLSSKKVIHGDLACRNVLLTEDRKAKLCDFGLSRQLYQYSQYVKKQQAPLPWRWMALESLKNFEFSTESDVWAFGVLLWEIFSLGELPYPGQLSWTNEFMQTLADGIRMSKPNYCLDQIYEIMMKCWNINPKERLTFSKLKNEFRHLLK